VLSYLQSMELTDVSTDAIVALAKQIQTKWCLVPKNVQESVLSRKLMFWASN